MELKGLGTHDLSSNRSKSKCVFICVVSETYCFYSRICNCTTPNISYCDLLSCGCGFRCGLLVEGMGSTQDGPRQLLQTTPSPKRAVSVKSNCTGRKAGRATTVVIQIMFPLIQLSHLPTCFSSYSNPNLL